MSNKHNGVVAAYFPERAYGFILENGAVGSRFNHFFHLTSCNFIPIVGQRVVFEIGAGKKGPAAVSVELSAQSAAAVALVASMALSTAKNNGGGK